MTREGVVCLIRKQSRAYVQSLPMLSWKDFKTSKMPRNSTSFTQMKLTTIFELRNMFLNIIIFSGLSGVNMASTAHLGFDVAVPAKLH
jgi:hypothetical protein